MTDNSLSKARTLGTLGRNPIARRDLVGPRDRVDFYKFSLRRSSNVQWQLTGLQANADLALLNRAGRVIARSRKGGKQAEQITRNLASGTYYVQVVSRSSKTTRYRLVGSATVGTGGAGGGTGTRDNPIDLGILTGGAVGRSRDTAGSLESAKIYKFQLAQISDLSIALSQVTGGGTMSLFYDRNRNGRFDINNDSPVLKVGEGSESSNRPISVVLPATGTYFLEVNRNLSSNTMLYDLTVNTTPVPGNIPTDPGSEPTTAFNLGTLNRGGRLEAKDYVGNLDSTDLYRFTLGETSNVTFSKLDVAGDINVGLSIYQDRNNNNILDSNEFVGQLLGSPGSINLQAGTYYVSISQSNLSNTAYAVSIAA